jgi:hypothetical protein
MGTFMWTGASGPIFTCQFGWAMPSSYKEREDNASAMTRTAPAEKASKEEGQWA